MVVGVFGWGGIDLMEWRWMVVRLEIVRGILDS